MTGTEPGQPTNVGDEHREYRCRHGHVIAEYTYGVWRLSRCWWCALTSMSTGGLMPSDRAEGAPVSAEHPERRSRDRVDAGGAPMSDLRAAGGVEFPFPDHGDTIGFVVVTWTAGSGWQDDWDGTVHKSIEDGRAALRECSSAGHTCVLTELRYVPGSENADAE